jgi:hypothetical protein
LMVGIVLYPTKYNIDNNYPGNGCPGLTRKNRKLAPSQLDLAITSSTGADTDKFKQFECTSIGESVAGNTADQRTLKPGIA